MAPGSSKNARKSADVQESTQEDMKKNTKTPISKMNLSTNNAFDAVSPPDNTVEICGYVDVSERPKTVGKDKKYNLVKFVLSNNSDRRGRVQCLSWQDQVERVKNIVELNQIIHLNGAVAKRIDNPAYNIGTVPFELNIREHTEVEVHGFFEEANQENVEPVAADWENVAEMDGQLIKITGWLKLMFHQAKHKTGEATYGIGAITNGTLKIAVRITNMERLPTNLIKGCRIVAIGSVQFDGPNPYLKVASGADIQILEGAVLSVNDMMEAVAMPSKRQRRE